jgi:hypothetical protein
MLVTVRVGGWRGTSYEQQLRVLTSSIPVTYSDKMVLCALLRLALVQTSVRVFDRLKLKNCVFFEFVKRTFIAFIYFLLWSATMSFNSLLSHSLIHFFVCCISGQILRSRTSVWSAVTRNKFAKDLLPFFRYSRNGKWYWSSRLSAYPPHPVLFLSQAVVPQTAATRRTLRSRSWHYCFVFGRFWVEILTRREVIRTEKFRGFPLSSVPTMSFEFITHYSSCHSTL